MLMTHHTSSSIQVNSNYISVAISYTMAMLYGTFYHIVKMFSCNITRKLQLIINQSINPNVTNNINEDFRYIISSNLNTLKQHTTQLCYKISVENEKNFTSVF